jgi:hypothetical protein
MKRREGFKNKVSTPRALLSPEIIILFEMKTLIVIDNFMGAYNYTGNRYIPILDYIVTLYPVLTHGTSVVFLSHYVQ